MYPQYTGVLQDRISTSLSGLQNKRTAVTRFFEGGRQAHQSVSAFASAQLDNWILDLAEDKFVLCEAQMPCIRMASVPSCWTRHPGMLRYGRIKANQLSRQFPGHRLCGTGTIRRIGVLINPITRSSLASYTFVCTAVSTNTLIRTSRYFGTQSGRLTSYRQRLTKHGMRKSRKRQDLGYR